MKKIMKQLIFVIIGGKPTAQTKDLLLEISKRGHIGMPVRMKDVVFLFEKGKFRAQYKNFEITTGDIFLFRGGYRTIKPAVSTLANYLASMGKILINDNLGSTGFFGDKIFQANQFMQKNIPHPRTMQALSMRDVPHIVNALGFPVIAKPMSGSKGFGIMKFDSEEKVRTFLRKNNNNRKYFLQEYIRIDGDFRIFVVGNKVIAGMKRYVLEGDFRSNASLGARASRIVLSDSLKNLSLKSAKAMNFEVAGVDIIEQGKELLVLEVNSAPQWKKLKEVTGINPAEEIIDYALRKYSAGKK